MKKSLMVSGMNFGTEFLTNLYKEVVKKGGTEETIFESLKTDSGLIPRFAEMIIYEANKAEKFPIWKTITIGGKSNKQLLVELEKGGFKVSDWAKNIMGKSAFTTAENPSEISLVRIKVRDFGFTKSPTTDQLFARAKEQGLNLCPAEAGPHLRLAFNDQLLCDCFWVAMEPIFDSDGIPVVFHVRRYDGGGRWLHADYADPEARWPLDTELVFLSK